MLLKQVEEKLFCLQGQLVLLGPREMLKIFFWREIERERERIVVELENSKWFTTGERERCGCLYGQE